MIGMMISPTSELTMPPKAAPMMTPTARSTTFPFIANSRNSLSMRSPFSSDSRTGRLTSAASKISVDQAGMDHGATHGDAGGVLHRNHRQPQLLVHLAEQRHRVLDRRRARLNEQVHV